MHPLHAYDYALWILNKACEVGALISLWRAGSLRKWYSITAYCLFHLALSVVLYPLLRSESYAAYFYVYWGGWIVGVALKGMILWQVLMAGAVILPPEIRRTLLISSTVIAIGSAVIGIQPGRFSAGEIANIAISMGRGADLALVGVFLVFLVFSRILGLTWSSRELLIDAGLTINSISTVVWFAFETLQAKSGMPLRDSLRDIAYIAGLIVWIAAFTRSEPKLSADKAGALELLQEISTELSSDWNSLTASEKL
jgi:hypothetical protein